MKPKQEPPTIIGIDRLGSQDEFLQLNRLEFLGVLYSYGSQG
jgi:hypothetical protein